MNQRHSTLKRLLSLCCCISLIASLLTPFNTAFAAGETITVSSAEQTPLVRKEQEGTPMLQEAEVAFTNNSEQPITCWVQATVTSDTDSGKTMSYTAPLEIPAGGSTQTVLCPDTNEMLDPLEKATLTLKGFQDEQCTGTPLFTYTNKEWERTRHWEFYLSESAHFDIGYTAYQEDLRKSFKSILDTAMQYIDASEARGDTEQYKYVIESAWALGDAYLQNCDISELENLLQKVDDKTLSVSASQFNYAMENFGVEETARAAYYTNRNLVDKLGITPNSVQRMFDNPAFSKSYVDVANSAGIKYGIHSMNVARSPYYQVRQHYLFYMQGNQPENKLLVLNGEHYNKNYGFDQPATDANVKAALENIFMLIDRFEGYTGERTYPYDKYPLQLVAGGGDNANPKGTQSQIASKINENLAASGYAYPYIKSAFPEEFFEAVEKEYGDIIPVETGTEENWWNDGWATTAYDSGTNKQAGVEIPVAETLASLASALTGEEYPYNDLSEAWRRNLVYDEHTWGVASWGNQSTGVVQAEWKRSNAYAAKVLADKVMGNALDTLAQGAGSDGKSIFVYNALNWSRSDVVTVEDLSQFPTYFAIMNGTKSLPYTIEDGVLTFVAENVPATGYKTFDVVELDSAPAFESVVKTGENYIENQYYKVTFAADGTISSIIDKSNGDREMVAQDTTGDDNEKFNQYRFYEDKNGENDPPVVLNMHTPDEGACTLTITSDGVRATAKMSGSAFRTPTLTQTVTLYNDIPRIDITNEVVKDAHNKKRDLEEVFYTFPFQADNYEIRYDLPVGNTKEGDQVYGTATNWYTVSKWVGVLDTDENYNMVLATPNTSLVQFGERRTGDWDFDYRSENPYLYSYVMNNQWHTNFADDQPGYADFRYSISTNKSGSDMAENARFGLEISTPLRATVIQQAQSGPKERTYINISAPNVQISTMKAAEANGEGMILRFAESDGKATDVTVRLPYSAKITETDIIENDLTGGVTANGTTFTFHIPAYGFKTFRIVQDGTAVGQVQNVTATTSGAGQRNLSLDSTATASNEYDDRFVADNAKRIGDGMDWAYRTTATTPDSRYIEFTWDTVQTVGSLRIADRTTAGEYTDSVTITLYNGAEQVWQQSGVKLPTGGAAKAISLPQQYQVTKLRVDVVRNSATGNGGLDGVEVYETREIALTDLTGTEITWDSVSGALYYQVFRGTSADFKPGSGNWLGSTTELSLYDTQVTSNAGKPYYYKVRAVSSGVVGTPSAAAESTGGTIRDTVGPDTPILHATVRSTTQIDLAWTPVIDNCYVDHYVLYRDGVQITDSGDDYRISYRDTGLQKGQTYTYYVEAVDSAGNVSRSNTVTIGTMDSAQVQLTSLAVSQGSLQPAFDPDVYSYTLPAGETPELFSVAITAAAQDGAAITINGQPVVSGQPTELLRAADSNYQFSIKVTKDGAVKTYTIKVTDGDPLIQAAAATAGSEYKPTVGNQTPNNLINNSGMSGTTSVTDTHDNHGSGWNMWHTDKNPGANAWVQIDLGGVYPVDKMYVWNMNQASYANRGLKNVKIEYSLTGEEGSWQELSVPKGMEFAEATAEGYPFQFAKASGESGSPATNLNDGSNTPVDFGGKELRYVRITAHPEAGVGSWGDSYFGLSEVRFTTKLTYGEAIDVTGITVNPETLTLSAGTKQTLTAEVTPANATYKSVRWSSEDESVATVDENGVVTGIDVGSTKITATTEDGKFSASCTVTVTAAELHMVHGGVSPAGSGTVSGSKEYAKGSEATLTATAENGYQFVKWMEGNREVSKSSSYTFTVSGDRELVAVFEKIRPEYISIPTPSAVTGIPNGTSLADLAGMLPSQVAVNTTVGLRMADVVWTVDETVKYNPATETEQTFTVSGVVNLPYDVLNTTGIPTTTEISVTVQAKDAVTVTQITIKDMPSQAEYVVGETFDPTGLTVTLTTSDGNTVDVAWEDFAAHGLTVSPAQDTVLTTNDQQLTVSAGVSEATGEIVVRNRVESPVFSPLSGIYTDPQTAEITCGTNGAEIYYTTDGSVPTTASNRYESPITVNSTTTIKAIAVKSGEADSFVAEARYIYADGGETFIPVTGITGVPTEAKVGQALALTGTVEPDTATNQAIVWSVKDPGTTGATIVGNALYTTGAGTVTITATIVNGTDEGVNFTKDFTINVTDDTTPVTYTVTFVTNGGTFVPSQQVPAGGYATQPSNPVRNGYLFTGWYTEQAQRYFFDTPVNGPLTLYAGWQVEEPYEPVEPSDPTYVITRPSDVKNGTFRVQPGRAEEGKTVTITAIPDDGYELDTLVVTDSKGRIITLSDKGNGKYTFKMPSSKVSVDVSFAPEDTPWVNPFIDVKSGDWYYEAVAYVNENGIMAGTNSNVFSPNSSVNRAMVWTVLARMAGKTTDGGETWYALAQQWAISAGVSDGSNPMGTITREQLVTMLWRYLGSPKANGDLSAYQDADTISSYAREAMAWGVETGLISGVGENTLNPTGGATRAQLATMLMRFDGMAD